MFEIPAHIQRAADRYKPVEVDGLTLYPITVAEYDDFMVASPAISFMQQSLPVTMLRVPLLTAYYRLWMQDIASGTEEYGDLFYRAMLFLALSLRIGEGLDRRDRVQQISPVLDRNNPSQLKCLRFRLNGEEVQEITPIQFQMLRPILAAQNGIEILPDDANPELVEAEREIAETNAPKLRVEKAKEISFVAALSHVDEDEIDRWPLLKLFRRRDTYQHMMRYLLCGAAEAQGGTWKGGNPVPHPFYERSDLQSGALRKLDDVAPGAADAVNKPGERISS